MKKTISFIIALFATVTLFAGGHFESYSYPSNDTTWSFKIFTDARDQWDSSKSENPPLSVKKAKELAVAFMKRVPLDDEMHGWLLSSISMICMSRKPEHWIYEIHFRAIPPGVWNGFVPQFKVLVRMDGTIPEPTIKKKEKGK